MTDQGPDQAGRDVGRGPQADGEAAGGRTISPVAGRFSIGRNGKAVTLTALVVGCGVFFAATWKPDRPKPKPDPVADQPARQVVPFEPAPGVQPTLAAPGPGAPNLNGSDPNVAAGVGQGPPAGGAGQGPAGAAASPAQAAQARAAQLQAIRSAPMMAYGQGGGGLAALVPTVSAGAAAAVSEATELDQLRRGSTIGKAQARMLGDRNFLILAGTSIPCVLQTAMDTSTPGYVTCLIPNDVYSDNGAVVLLEKGAKVLGEYRSGMRQGQRRLFVLWTRAVTPAGVAISLASPASDALGRAGFDGAIDTHFWDRFGGALLLSIVDDGADALAGNDRSYGQTARVPSDAAGIALQNSVNIPPTLRKPQGSEVAIFVAQDFDFSRVYSLRSR